MRSLYLTLVLLAVPCAPASSQITNHEAPGNLQARTDTGCLKIDALQNTYTAADLYQSSVACVQQDDFESAVNSFVLAGVYGRYDTMRVADRSAHQAQTVLQMNLANALTEEQKKLFTAQLSATANNASSLEKLCSQTKKVGPPNYHPSYMIQHGMGAFLGAQGNGLVSNFDSAAAWEKALTTYLHCPKS